MLLLPIVGFLPADDPRMLGTVKALEQGLLKDGLLPRNLPRTSRAEQGEFLACSFWLVEIHAMSGRQSDARSLFEMLLTLANDVACYLRNMTAALSASSAISHMPSHTSPSCAQR